MSTVALDKKVPAFKGETTGGPFKLSDAKGENLVIYFYPKDNTSGCTQEGHDFRDQHAKFKRAHTRILGVSRDSLSSHENFKSGHGFPFELLSDPDETVCRLFDVIREKNMYGRRVMGVERSTFLIDANGVLRREWRKVKVPGHVEEVLEAVKALA